MPKQNRVTPFGELIATERRGTLMGNRGCLHDERQRIRAGVRLPAVDRLRAGVPRPAPDGHGSGPVYGTLLPRRGDRPGGRAPSLRRVPARPLPAVPRHLGGRQSGRRRRDGPVGRSDGPRAARRADRSGQRQAHVSRLSVRPADGRDGRGRVGPSVPRERPVAAALGAGRLRPGRPPAGRRRVPGADPSPRSSGRSRRAIPSSFTHPRTGPPRRRRVGLGPPPRVVAASKVSRGGSRPTLRPFPNQLAPLTAKRVSTPARGSPAGAVRRRVPPRRRRGLGDRQAGRP